MNLENLSETYQAKLKQLLLHDKRLATAYRLKEELRLIFKLSPDEVSAALDKWRRRAWSCRIEQFVKLQRKIKGHKDTIIATITNGISNARIEATNNKIKLFGTIIQENINSSQWNYGAALSLVMLVIIGITSLLQDNKKEVSGGMV